MKFSSCNSVCSRCGEYYRKLNYYGLCGDCWARLSSEQRSAFTGDEFKVIPQTVYVPTPSLKTMLFWAMLMGWISGFGGAWAFVKMFAH